MTSAKFRPISHFIAPHSWANDPCGATYVPETQEYILCYQWNPGTTEVGNTAWGMAKSKDLVRWEDCEPALRNGTTYDKLGVYSGCIVSRRHGAGTADSGDGGSRRLFLFYTSVSHIPIHWTQPYVPGCETQSLAISDDYGISWTRLAHNPLLRRPPRSEHTTGWRDPFVSPWRSLSRLLRLDTDTTYMMLSSGIRGIGPLLQLLRCTSASLDEWTDLGVIITATAGSPIAPTSQLKWGHNFECGSFFTLGNQDYVLMGVEGEPESKFHNERYLLWLSGYLVLENQTQPRFIITGHGLLDYGIAYAAHPFRDAEQRLIQFAWADESAKPSVISEQGWAGCMTHPRELYELAVPISAQHDPNIWHVNEAVGTMTTLGIRPAPQLTLLQPTTAPTMTSLCDLYRLKSATYELQADFGPLSGTEKFIFHVRVSGAGGGGDRGGESTEVIFDIAASMISVDRRATSQAGLGAATADTGVLQLLPGEKLSVNIYVDNSVVEVFANGRFALTSRIYPSSESAIGAGYDFGAFAEDKVRFACWDGLRDAWPKRVATARPEISSSTSCL